MASGASVVEIEEVSQPATLFAPLIRRAGGSTPSESFLLYAFDAATDWYLDFKCRLQGYAGGGLTFTILWSAATATTGVTRWGIAVRRLADDAEDQDASHTYDFNEVDATTASATGEFAYDTITFTNGADMDSWADGEWAMVRVKRSAAHANDTMAGNAELGGIVGKET